MGLNISKGNMYPWITHTWNTIKGACYHDCSYCYMKRWGKLNPIRFDEKELKEFDRDIKKYGDGLFIFVGSSNDMFAEDVPAEWIIKTLSKCSEHDNTYLFQSKNPKGFISLGCSMPDKLVLCTTIETNRKYGGIMDLAPEPRDRAHHMSQIPIKEKYVTIEPIMYFDHNELVEMIRLCDPIQVNIGADSGNNNLPEPTPKQIYELIAELQSFTKVKMKKNLKRLLK